MTDKTDKTKETDKTDKTDKVIDKTYVATPDELIDFVANSVKHILKTEFGKDMDDPDVQILDPFAGKGCLLYTSPSPRDS